MDLLLQKLQNDYLKNRNSKTEAKLQHAKTTTGAIRKQLDQLTGGQGPTTPEVRFHIQSRSIIYISNHGKLYIVVFPIHIGFYELLSGRIYP